MPSGRTNKARAFRQRSSRPRVAPSRTPSGRVTDSYCKTTASPPLPLPHSPPRSGVQSGRGGEGVRGVIQSLSLFLFPELLQVLRPLFGRDFFLSLDGDADLLDHVRIGEGR